MNDSIAIFDRPAVQRHRERAARATSEVDFLINEVTERLLERLQEIKRNFTFVLDLGCREGRVARHVSSRVVNLDPAFAYAARAPGPRLVAEAEALPFAPRSFDLVTSILTLHWINDLPGALWQIREILKPDGLALGAFFGGETLYELRRAFIEAELALEGGAAPRVSPFADIRDLGGLLQRAGFALPVVERDAITVTYPHPLALMEDLRAMGETNAVRERRRNFTRRGTLTRACERYQEIFGDAEGRIPATFEVLTFTAWAPDESQPRPKRRGSATTRLGDALKEDPATPPPADDPPAASARDRS